MARNDAKSPSRPTGPIPYRLIFERRGDDPSVLHATLKSPLLDPTMHPTGSVPVVFTLASEDEGDDQFSLDSFQVDSLVDFLNLQADVRRAIEAALCEHLPAWNRERKGRPPHGVWAHVRVRAVRFDRRQVVTSEDIANTRAAFPTIGDEYLALMLAKSDRPETRSRFAVDFTAPWRDGHGRLAEFRDGELLPLRVEGRHE